MTTGEANAYVGPLRVPPALDALNETFWRSGADETLRMRRCRTCGSWDHPPSSRCRRCYSQDVTDDPVTGFGTVAAYTVNHQQWNPEGATAPYIVAMVELDEQPHLRITTNVVGIDPADVHVGMRVRAVFQPLEDVYLPLFVADVANDDDRSTGRQEKP